MQGWISLYRELLDNPIVCKDTEHFTIWIYLLLQATHVNQKKIFNGNQITLKRGQLITGRKKIAEKFNIHESKVQRILKTLEIEQMIEQQTSNKNRLITVINYNDYQINEQQNEQQLNNKRTTTEQQLNTNNNDNNINNNNNVIKKDTSVSKKTRHLDYVLLFDEEYEKLIELMGSGELSKYIENLNNYIGSKGKKYKSHYYVIRQWYNKDNKDKPKEPGYIKEYNASQSYDTKEEYDDVDLEQLSKELKGV